MAITSCLKIGCLVLSCQGLQYPKQWARPINDLLTSLSLKTSRHSKDSCWQYEEDIRTSAPSATDIPSGGHMSHREVVAFRLNRLAPHSTRTPHVSLAPCVFTRSNCFGGREVFCPRTSEALVKCQYRKFLYIAGVNVCVWQKLQ